MNKDIEKTVVIFRKEKDNTIVAFFPYLPEFRFNTCMCYAHIGQHATTSLAYLAETKPATSEEYIELFNELENQVGYNLKVMKNVNRKKYSDVYHNSKPVKV